MQIFEWLIASVRQGMILPLLPSPKRYGSHLDDGVVPVSHQQCKARICQPICKVPTQAHEILGTRRTFGKLSLFAKSERDVFMLYRVMNELFYTGIQILR
jgi:hypothetical protein